MDRHLTGLDAGVGICGAVAVSAGEPGVIAFRLRHSAGRHLWSRCHEWLAASTRS